MSSSGCFGGVMIGGFQDASNSYRLGITIALRFDVLIHLAFYLTTPQSNFLWSPTRAGEVTPSMLNKQPDFMSGAA